MADFDRLIEINKAAMNIQPNLAAFSTVLANVSNRIFEQGRATSGQQIGSYSTKPVYVGASSFLTKGGANRVLGSKQKRKRLYEAAEAADKPGFIPKSSPGPGGKGAIYFTEGYKGIRQADGRQTAYVDLNYEGKMAKAYVVEVRGNSVLLGFTNDLDAKKMRGNEKRFGKEIIPLSADEIQLGVQTYANELRRIYGVD